jgi:transcription-repair coupling factor (superfamily II helicase)
VSQGIAPGGIEYFLPLFFDRTSHLFEYLPPDSILVDMNDAASAVEGLWKDIVERHEQLRHDRHRPLLDPAEVYLTPAQFLTEYSARQQVQLHTFEWPPETVGPMQNFPSVAPAVVRIDPRAESPAAQLVSHIHASRTRVLLAAESAGRRELLLDLLRGRDIQAKIFDNFAALRREPIEPGNHGLGRRVGNEA